MQIIYGQDYTQPHKSVTRYLGPGGTGERRATNVAVDAFVLFNTTGGDFWVEASQDGFLTTVHQTQVTNHSGTLMVALPNPVTGAEWRVRAIQECSLGTLYPGKRIEVSDPDFPFRMEEKGVYDGNETRGGVRRARLRYRVLAGSLNFSLVPSSEMVLWRAFLAATKDMQQPWVVEHPVTSDLHLVTGYSDGVPFTLDNPGYYSGGFDVKGVR